MEEWKLAVWREKRDITQELQRDSFANSRRILSIDEKAVSTPEKKMKQATAINKYSQVSIYFFCNVSVCKLSEGAVAVSST